MFYDRYDLIKDLEEFKQTLKKIGIYEEFTVENVNIKSFLKDYEYAVKLVKFKTKKRYSEGNFTHHFATRSRVRPSSMFVFTYPGSYTPEEDKHSVEAEFFSSGNEVFIKLVVIPLLFHKKNFISAITQNVLEKLSEDNYSLEKMDGIINELTDNGYDLIEGIPREINWKFPFEYDLEAKKYYFRTEAICPFCNHEFSTFIEMKSMRQERGETKCHKCYREFSIAIV
ncbi:MAG: hypothetical protein JSV49_07780 [Thermoplasmata archaeon]|nr:MAG: hypothetical protein JSV49_07780 [Thermoplasmata archaeon]